MSIVAFDRESLMHNRGRIMWVYSVFKIPRDWTGARIACDDFLISFVHEDDAKVFAHDCKTLNKHYCTFEVRKTILKF